MREMAGSAAALTGAVAALYQIHKIYGEYNELKTKCRELETKLRTLIANNQFEQRETLEAYQKTKELFTVQGDSLCE